MVLNQPITTRILISLLIHFFSLSLKSQTSTGWHHLLKGAETKVLNNWADNNNKNVFYNIDEILLVFELKGSSGFAIDVDGRVVQIMNMEKTKKINAEGRVVKMTKDIDVSLSKKFKKNNNVWLVGFNSANNTAKILLSNEEIVEIPRNLYIELSQYYLNNSRGFVSKTVTD
ncbi:MAG: hypothetical protein RL728_718 [Bacteroidota bacterium]|jgi:hypothetical protein